TEFLLNHGRQDEARGIAQHVLERVLRPQHRDPFYEAPAQRALALAAPSMVEAVDHFQKAIAVADQFGNRLQGGVGRLLMAERVAEQDRSTARQLAQEAKQLLD